MKILSLVRYIRDKKSKTLSSNQHTMFACYLCDWKSCIEYGRQMTEATWTMSTHGPSSNIVREILVDNVAGFSSPELSDEDIAVAEFVVESIERWYEEDEKEREFMVSKLRHIVYSTYPCISTDLNERMDLPALARQYAEELKALGGE